MSKAPGVCLQEYDWPWHTTSGPPSQSRWALDPRPLSEDGKAKVMRQLGYLAHELSKLRFDKIGSLFEDAEKGGYVVKECLAPAFVWEDRDTLDLNRGPFDEELAYYESLTASTKMQAEYLPMSPHLFLGPVPHPDDYSCWTSFTLAHDRWNDFATIGKRIDSGENRVDYWIASDMANEMMRQTFPKEETTVPSRGFPLRHPDLSRGNIFVDEDLNITCVIDWGFASTVPFPELLACFGMPNPRFLPDPPLIAAFRAGYEERLGRSIDPRFWEDTMKMWNFQRLVSMDSKHTYHHFAALYDLVHKPDEPVNVAALVRQQHASESSQELLKELSEDDEDRAKIAQAEKDYFDPRRGMVSREAIMRKMSVVAQLNPAMVVDKRLWHWIEEALDEEASDEEESRDSDTTKSDSKSSVSGSLESGSSDFEIPDSEIPEPESLDSKSADS
ncbi:hypothetical protein IMZ48_43320 [Candidatus Bathyarchaeota archaeon]|nr:hypothetical protein [Candidatus Bathyarchaeota archaeon]